MALFVLICLDKPDSLDLRMATRPAHLAYAGTFSDVVKLGGPILDDKGDMAGSLIILEGESEEAARAFTRDDPYSLAGLFQSVQILPFRATVGNL
ncbi:MAG: YciI family protein [Pseudomonadota bacterium]|uniref:YciI family protein n=1 Tax=Phenylobacterium sp. TaxID=1871053 RepID=UPI00271DC8F2|nr:YciI family protein [Phenylobacterium sp.]MDO8379911.1 YciI family protein [Phenylobacterium sp.]